MKYSIRSCFLPVLAALTTIWLSGCASGVTREPAATSTSAPAPYRLSADKKVGEVTVTISPEAKEKLKDNLKFDQEQLRKHMERALTGYSLLDATRKGELPVLEIVVTSMRVRSNFSAVMWGVMAGADNISGDIVLKDAAGKTMDHFHVSASYALGGLAGGQDEARMGWLYEAFAKRAMEELTGIKGK